MFNMIDHLYESQTLRELAICLSDKYPNRPIVTIARDNQRNTFTYQEIMSKALSLCPTLEKHTQQGDRVIIATGTSKEFIISFFACLFSGRIAVPIPVEKANSRYSRLKSVIEDCSPRFVFFRTEHEKKIMEDTNDALANTTSLVLEDFQPTASWDLKSVKINPESIALIQYTSGSTSNPKGVVLTHKNILANLRMIQQGMNITSEDRIISWLPMHHDMGLIGMLLSFFATGAHTLIYPYQEFSRNPLSWLHYISEEKATLSGAPNFAFDILARKLEKGTSENYDLSTLRLLYCGSERIQPLSIQKFYKAKNLKNLKQNSFFPCYGLAEASLYVSGGHVSPKDLLTINKKFPTCGFIANGLKVEFLNETGQRIAPESPGRIFISGDSVSKGYWNYIYDKSINGDLSSIPYKELDTGDIGLLENQNLIITGRSKDLIKIRGRNLYPEDIEHLIENEVPYFQTNSVVAFGTSKNHDESIHIVGEIDRVHRKKPKDDILSKIQSILSTEGLIAKKITLLPPLSLPKTSSGKKQRLLTKNKIENNEITPLWSEDFDNETSESSTVDFSLENFKQEINSMIDFNLADERRTFPPNLINILNKHKIMGLFIPKSEGGSELNSKEFLQVGKTLGQIHISLGALVGNHNTIGVLPIKESSILKHRKAILRDIAENGSIAAFAITEPEAGANPREIISKAIHIDNNILINGEKVWIGNAGLARYISIFVREEVNGKEIGISGFLLDKEKHIFHISSEQLTLGLKAMPQHRIVLENTKLSDEDRLTEPGKGLDLAYQAMEYARFGLLTLALGGIDTALSIVERYASLKKIWGGLLKQNSVYQTQMGYLQFKKNIMESLANNIAKRYDLEKRISAPFSLTCKIIAGEWTFAMADWALQFSGGRGYTDNFGLSSIFRDSRVLRIFEGPTEALAVQLGSLLKRTDLATLFSISIPQSVIESYNECKNTLTSKDSQGTINEYHLGLYGAQVIAGLCHLTETPESESQIDLWIQSLGKEYLNKQKSLALFNYTPMDNTLNQKNTLPPLYDNWMGWENFNTSIKETEVVDTLSTRKHEASKNTLSLDNETIPQKVNLISDDITKTLKQWVFESTRRRVDNLEIPLSSYGFDSLLAYELLCFVEEEFDVTLPESIVTSQPSINNLNELILMNMNINPLKKD